MNLNQLTGADLMAARTHIGLSISAVAKLTGINRNTLSQFEQEKASLSGSEKKRLAGCYEERGYHFDEPQTTDETVLATRYDDARERLVDAAYDVNMNGLGEAVLALADASHDLLSMLARPMDVAQEEVELDAVELPESYLEMHNVLQRHFLADKAGQMQGKVGFFKEDADERSAKLIAYMAQQYLTLLHAEMPEVVSLERDSLDDDSDNARVLDALTNWTFYDALKEMTV
ncbi:helix-turn-helix domain-containing protein [Vibrio cholerae]|uniref:helix-turn-helix domain-containing protein n=1 Tax=Vibrio cholerae TaxID=666 RepID=UPI0039F4D982